MKKYLFILPFVFMVSLISAQGLTKNGAILSNDLTPSSLKVGTVTYPNTNGISGQVLTTNGEGTATWMTPLSSASASSFPMISTSERDALGITTPGYVVFNSTTNTYQGTQAILSPYDNLTTTIYGEARCKGSYYLTQTFRAAGQTISSATLSVYQVITPGNFHFALIDSSMGFTVSEADFAVSSANANATVSIPLSGQEGNLMLWGSNYTIKITCLDGGDVKFLLNANQNVGTYYNSLDSFTSTGHNISCKLNLVAEGVKWINTNSDITSSALSNTYLPLNGGQLTGDLLGTNVTLSGNVTATEYKTPSGTSSQYLMADGSIMNAGTGRQVVSTVIIDYFELNNYDVSNVSIIFVRPDSIWTNIYGLQGGVLGQIIHVYSVNNQTSNCCTGLSLWNYDAGDNTGIQKFVAPGNYNIDSDRSTTLVFDGTYWRVSKLGGM